MRKIAFCLAAMIAFSVSSVKSQTAMSFLEIIDAPRANGMGDCVTTLVDEQAIPYNPAILGLFHFNKNFAITIPSSTKWLPKLTDGNLKLRTFGFSLGYSHVLRLSPRHKNPDVSVALGYSRLKVDFGLMPQWDENANLIGFSNDFDKTDNFTFGIGIDYYLKIGLGASYKSAMSKYGFDTKLTAKSSDLGIIMELPLAEIIDDSRHSDDSGRKGFSLGFTPSFAYVVANRGNNIQINGESGVANLPNLNRTGFSFLSGLKWKKHSVVSLRYLVENQKLPRHSDYNIGKYGFEIGAGDAFFARFGSMNFTYSDNINTIGFGSSLRGILNWLEIAGWLHSRNGSYGIIPERFDISIDYAHYTGDPGDSNYRRGTSFTRLTLSL